MAIYSIKDIEKLSGIKAHTIRMWEQRYGIVEPKRTETNIRYYSDNDLKKMLNVALLNKNGIKISKIAKMTAEAIGEKVAAISEINYEYGTQLDALTLSMIEMDEVKFDRIVSANVRQMGFEQTMIEVLYPFLEKISLLWLTGSISPVQENYIGYLIRQQIVVAINELPLRSSDLGTKKFLVYLPEGEKQELSLLFMHYLVKSRGHQVIYIGHDISILDLNDVSAVHQPDFVFTMISETFVGVSLQDYLDNASNVFSDSQIITTGYQVIAQGIQSSKKISIHQSLMQTIDFLDKLSVSV